MKILCFGAGGFIGSHLTARLLADGHDVTAVDVHADKIEELLRHPRLRYLDVDIRDAGLDLASLRLAVLHDHHAPPVGDRERGDAQHALAPTGPQATEMLRAHAGAGNGRAAASAD